MIRRNIQSLLAKFPLASFWLATNRNRTRKWNIQFYWLSWCFPL